MSVSLSGPVLGYILVISGLNIAAGNTLPTLERAFIDQRRKGVTNCAITKLPDDLLELALCFAGHRRLKPRVNDTTCTGRVGGSLTSGSKQRVAKC